MWSIPSGLLVHGRWLGSEGILWWVQLHICHIVCCWCVVAKSCLTLCNPMDCSPPGASVHGISQARILEWVAISSSRGSSQPRDWTQVFCIAGGFFTSWATREALIIVACCNIMCFVIQLCLTLCDPMDCSPPDPSVHGILQARILGWVTVPFSRVFSWPRDRTQVSCRKILYHLSHQGSTFYV